LLPLEEMTVLDVLLRAVANAGCTFAVRHNGGAGSKQDYRRFVQILLDLKVGMHNFAAHRCVELVLAQFVLACFGGARC
jgi:hypothetical protein